MGQARRYEEPLARGEGQPFAVDLEDGRAGQEDHPLVLVLDVSPRPCGPAENLLDNEVAEAEDLLEPLAIDRRPGGGEQGAAAPDGRNVGLEGVVLADDPPPPAAPVIPRADSAKEEDDQKHEKKKFEHEIGLPAGGLIESRRTGFVTECAGVVRRHG